MDLYKGFLFHNRYLLVDILGRGASAEVWKAKDTKANNLIVALKIFAYSSSMDTYGLQDFKREFTSVYNLKHSNLLPPTGYDIFEGRPYLIMQYCENGSCSSMAGRMDENDIIKFLHDAPYLNNPKNAQSFTVTLQLENQKTVTLWGMDLKTALEGIRAQADAQIPLRVGGAVPFHLPRPQ